MLERSIMLDCDSVVSSDALLVVCGDVDNICIESNREHKI